jgi:hypothetical protein
MRCFPCSGKVPPAGFEPAAHGLGIHRRSVCWSVPDLRRTNLRGLREGPPSRVYPAGTLLPVLDLGVHRSRRLAACNTRYSG